MGDDAVVPDHVAEVLPTSARPTSSSSAERAVSTAATTAESGLARTEVVTGEIIAHRPPVAVRSGGVGPGRMGS